MCGLKEPEDVEAVNALSVDYAGFVFYPPSPRFVGQDIGRLVGLLKKAKAVGVFVNPGFEEVKKALDRGIDLIQLHGDESLEFARKIGLSRVIKAFRVKESFDLEVLKPWRKAYAVLLDTYKKGLPGGTGECFDWEIAERAVKMGLPIFLAGGLNPENVALAVKKVKPYAVDVSSGVEKRPGKKDLQKLALFVKRAKGG